MDILIKKNNDVVIPKQGKPNDAAYDIVAIIEPVIIGEKIEIPMENLKLWSRITYISYKTAIFIAPQDEDKYDGEHFAIEPDDRHLLYHTLIVPRSSISNKNLVLANSIGVIDHGYRGEIEVRFKYIIQPEDIVMVPQQGYERFYVKINLDSIYKKGEKIAQIKASPNIPINFKVVDSLDETARGAAGFGSTDKV